MSFGAPQFLYALAVLPALMVFVRWALARRAASVRRIGDPVLVERLSLAASRTMRTLSTRSVVCRRRPDNRRLGAAPMGQRHRDCRATRGAGDGRLGYFAQYARPGREAHPPRPGQAGNIRLDFTAGRRRGWHCPVLRRQLHPVPLDVRLRHRPGLPESRQPGFDHPPGHRHRRGHRDGNGRLQQSAAGSENHRHYDGR